MQRINRERRENTACSILAGDQSALLVVIYLFENQLIQIIMVMNMKLQKMHEIYFYITIDIIIHYLTLNSN